MKPVTALKRQLLIYCVALSILLSSCATDAAEVLHRCEGGIGGGAMEGEANAEFHWAPDGSKILFSVARSQVVLIELTQFPEHWSVEELHPLTERRAFDFDWSPDGRQLTFVSRNEGASIFHYDMATQQVRQITEGHQDFNPLWSPDGQRLAFYRDGGQLFAMNPDGSELRQLTEDSVGHAVWSSDGTQFAFVSFDTPDDIFTMTLDGKVRERLTDTKACEAAPQWSPTGRAIAYLAAPDLTGNVYLRGSENEVIALTDTSIDIRAFDWSPDGKLMAVIGRTGDPLSYSQDLYLLDTTNGRLSSLTDTSTEEESLPRWSPDGRGIAFLVYDDSEWHLDFIDVERSERVRLASLPKAIWIPADGGSGQDSH